MPTSELKSRPVKATSAVEASEESNPFAGLPLQAWAERLGERVMPAYELIKEEQQRAKTAAKPAAAPTPSISVPHLLPITRWCVCSFLATPKEHRLYLNHVSYFVAKNKSAAIFSQ